MLYEIKGRAGREHVTIQRAEAEARDTVSGGRVYAEKGASIQISVADTIRKQEERRGEDT